MSDVEADDYDEGQEDVDENEEEDKGEDEEKEEEEEEGEDKEKDDEEALGEEEGEGEGEGDDEEKPMENPLSKEAMADALGLLCKIGNGLSHAFVRCDLKERALTDINIIQQYIHLRYLDFSQNYVKDIVPVGALSHLLVLVAKDNKIAESVNKLQMLPYLQIANFSGNKIKSLDGGFNHPQLEMLNLNMNQIRFFQNGLDSNVLQRLHTLELRGNKLTSTEGLFLPNLRNLFLASNMLASLSGISSLTKLETLHLRENQLESLEGFGETNAELKYVNLRGNQLKESAALEPLKILPKLAVLIAMENPLSEEQEGEYRVDVLVRLRRLGRLDKIDFTEDERQEAEQRIAEAEAAEAAEQQLEDENDY